MLGLRLTHNAYVKGLLHKLIYVKAPRELDVQAGKVLKLLKPLYGLKQSGRCWNETMNKYIIARILSSQDSTRAAILSAGKWSG